MRYASIVTGLCVICAALVASCGADRGIAPDQDDAGDGASVGEIHNAFVSAYLEARGDRSCIDKRERLEVYARALVG